MPAKQTIRYRTVPSAASAGVDIIETMGSTRTSSRRVTPADTAINSVAVLPMMREAFSRSFAPTARPMVTVDPIASPTMTADGDGGGAVDAVELADDEQVGHAVQGLQKVGQQIGQGKIQNILKYAPGGQVSLHGGLLLWTVEKPTTVKIVGFRRGLAYSS